MNFRAFSLLFFSAVLFSACMEEPQCIEPDTHYFNLSFKKIVDGSSLSVKIDSIYHVEQMQSFNKGDSISSIQLPFSPLHNLSTFVLTTEFKKDTVSFSYDLIPKLYATSCDVTMLFTNTNYETNTFDSVNFDFFQLPPNVQVYY